MFVGREHDISFFYKNCLSKNDFYGYNRKTSLITHNNRGTI